MSGFIVWLVGVSGSVFAWRGAKHSLRHSRWAVAMACVVVAVASALLATLHMPETPVVASPEAVNTPIGAPQGIHPGRVVWTHNPNATSWIGTDSQGHDIGGGYWWQNSHTNQAVVDDMMSKTLRGLTGEASDVAAWQALFCYFNQKRGKATLTYQPGEKISIKPNLCTAIRTYSNIVDANGNQIQYLGWVNTSPQMILSLLRQLVNIVGVAQNDIAVGDTTTYFPNHYWNICHTEFPNVHYVACSSNWGRDKATSSKGYACESKMHWTAPEADSFTPDYLPVNYAEADYLINFSCLKGHSSGITLCGKNHYGSFIRTPSETGYYNLHYSLPNQIWSPGMGRYRAIVDIMGRSDLGQKTLLYMIDGLYGGYMSEGRPYKWNMEPFNGDWPSSLFASQDPVAIDSVGYDFLLKEWPHIVAVPGLDGGAEDYLHEAAQANNPPSQTIYQPDGEGHPLIASLGVHEHWNNYHDKQYSVNLGLGPGIELLHIGPPPKQPGDYDGNGYVDDVDLKQFELCALGPSIGQYNATCEWARLDYDEDVDQDDFALFQRCWSGASPANPNCAN